VPRLSIIIPVLGNLDRPSHLGNGPSDSHLEPGSPQAARLETTLVSVLENRPPDCEILVVHDAPYDDPYDLAAEIRFLPVTSDRGLVDNLNYAIHAAQGSIVHVLAAGLEVTEGWTEAALAHFEDSRVASVAPLVVDVLDRRKVHAAGLTYSCRRGRQLRVAANSNESPPGEILGPPIQAAFFRRSAIECAGGLPTAVGDALADADLALALRFAGFRSILEPRSIVMIAEAFEASPIGFRPSLMAERLFWRAAPIMGWGKSLLAHPWGILSDFLRAGPRFAALLMLLGRLLGACQMGSHRAYHRRLSAIRDAAMAQFRAERGTRVRMDGPHLPAAPTAAVRVSASG
jgi:GT2 family glycosyltransferase